MWIGKNIRGLVNVQSVSRSVYVWVQLVRDTGKPTKTKLTDYLVFTSTYPHSENCVHSDDSNKEQFN